MNRLRVRVDRIDLAARETRIFTLSPVDGGVLPPAEPGAHIDLFLGSGLVRPYSLLVPSPEPYSYVVGVKKDRDGRGGSRYMHEQLRAGDEIEISPPRNNFPLTEKAVHTVLIAGGIGITPVWAMAQRLIELGSSWRLYASNRSREDTPLLAELSALDNVSLHFDDEAGGFMDLAAIIAAAPDSTHFYCCGPAPMLAAYQAATAHLDARFVHYEVFGADLPAQEGDTGFIVRLSRSGLEIAVPASDTILNTLRANGIESPSSCEAGVCGMCETRVLEGEVDHRDLVLTPDEQALNTRMMICCSRARSPVLTLDL